MPKMRQAFGFSKLLTETSYLFILEKAAIFSIYDKNKTENMKIHHFKDKIAKQNKIKNEKTFGTWGLSPGRHSTSQTL